MQEVMELLNRKKDRLILLSLKYLYLKMGKTSNKRNSQVQALRKEKKIAPKN
jgi:hypothetical protein